MSLKLDLTEAQELKLMNTLIRKYPKQAQELHLSNQQMDILNIVRSQCHTKSSEIAETFNMSVNQASTLLKQLCDGRWIGRFPQSQVSGGTEWVYCRR